MAITPELPQAARGSNSPGIITWRPFIFAVSHALPEAVVNPADLVLSPKEGLNKGLAQGRGALAVVHRPQYEMIGACWSVFEMSAPLIGRVADTLRPLAAQ
jgi:hypothetical protein